MCERRSSTSRGRAARACRTAVAAALLLTGSVRADDAPVPSAGSAQGPPDFSVTSRFTIGAAWSSTVSGGRSPQLASGLELLARWRWLLVGGVLDFTSADADPAHAYAGPQDPGYGGSEERYVAFAGGAAWEPRPGARLQVLALGGSHQVAIQSNLVLPDAAATLPFVGLELGAFALLELRERHPLVLFARRVGFSLIVGLRTDLASSTVHPAVPPEATNPPAVAVGGTSVAVTAGAALEW
jgi:hypothetical protein